MTAPAPDLLLESRALPRYTLHVNKWHDNFSILESLSTNVTSTLKIIVCNLPKDAKARLLFVITIY